MTYTKEEKNTYFKNLRERWAKVKALSLTDSEAKAIYEEVKNMGIRMSYTSFYFTLLDMQHAGLEGTPYIDCKTFNLWKSSGFRVKRGEHSKIDGITWIGTKDEDGLEDRTNVYPKVYHLFHKSQVEPISV